MAFVWSSFLTQHKGSNTRAQTQDLSQLCLLNTLPLGMHVRACMCNLINPLQAGPVVVAYRNQGLERAFPRLPILRIYRSLYIACTQARLDAAARDASEVYHLCPCWDVVVPALIEGGVEQLKQRQADVTRQSRLCKSQRTPAKR
jgi:hypothetical protein